MRKNPPQLGMSFYTLSDNYIGLALLEHTIVERVENGGYLVVSKEGRMVLNSIQVDDAIALSIKCLEHWKIEVSRSEERVRFEHLTETLYLTALNLRHSKFNLETLKNANDSLEKIVANKEIR